MDWKNLVVRIVLWLLNVTRILAVIAFLVLVYMILFNDVVPKLTLPVGNGSGMVQDVESLAVPEQLRNRFEEISLQTSGYDLEIGIKGSAVALYILVVGVSLGLYIYFATLLSRLVEDALASEFFNMKNIMRMRIIGLSLIGFDLFMRLVGYLTKQFFYKFLEHETKSGVNVDFVPDIFNNSIFLGLMVLVIALAFEHGLKIQEEQELTI